MKVSRWILSCALPAAILAAAVRNADSAVPEPIPVTLYTAETVLQCPVGESHGQLFNVLAARPRNGLVPGTLFARVGFRMALLRETDPPVDVKLSLWRWKGSRALTWAEEPMMARTARIDSAEAEWVEIELPEPVTVRGSYLLTCEPLAPEGSAVVLSASLEDDGGEANDAFVNGERVFDREYQVRLAGGTVDRPWTDPRFGVGGGDLNGVFRFGSIKTWGVNEKLLQENPNTHCGIVEVNWGNLHKFIRYDPTNGVFAVDNVRSHPGFRRVREWVTKYPGRVWEIGNEPDWGPYFRPIEYAKWYHDWYTEIKRWDPTARVMNGGIAWPIYDNPHKWRSKELVDSPELDRPSLRKYSREFRNHNAWMLLVMDEYRRMYGEEMPVDIYAFHPYNTQYGTAGVAADIENSKRNFVSFREFLETIGQGHKPAWATEWGLLARPGALIGRPYVYKGPDGCGAACAEEGMCYRVEKGDEDGDCCWPYAPDPAKDCFTFEERQTEWNGIAEFMEMIPWLIEGRYAQRFSWFMSSDSTIRRGKSEYICPSVFFLRQDGDLCLTAKTYRGWALAYQDRHPPRVEIRNIRFEGDELVVRARSGDGFGRPKPGRWEQSGIAEYYYRWYEYPLSREYGIDWVWVGDLREEVTFRLPRPDVEDFVFEVKAVDAAGNESRVKYRRVQNPMAPIVP